VKLILGPAAAESAKADIVAVTVVEGGAVEGVIGKAAARSLAKIASDAAFTGKEGKTLVVAAPKAFAARSVMLVGLGRRGRDLAEATRRAAGTALSKAGDAAARRLAFAPPSGDAAIVAAACEGFLLADYSFSKYKTSNGAKKDAAEKTIQVACPPEAKKAVGADMPRLQALAAGVKVARDLGNEPANVLTPVQLAEEAMAVARSRKADGVKC
jgi:leucyl aminopeptidase